MQVVLLSMPENEIEQAIWKRKDAISLPFSSHLFFAFRGGTNMKMNMKLTDNQTAFEYAVYMIVGSYFQSAGCKSVLQEQRMRIQYWEQKLDTQYRMEDCCIRYVERQLLEQVPKDCWEQKVKVTFCTDSETGESEIRV